MVILKEIPGWPTSRRSARSCCGCRRRARSCFSSRRSSGRFSAGRGQRGRVAGHLGHGSRWISVVPANPVGDAALRELRRYRGRRRSVVRGGRRLGIYFAETGANERPSQVIYDREGSAIAEAGPGAVEWAAALDRMDWLHLTGITPALGASAAGPHPEAAKAARRRG